MAKERKLTQGKLKQLLQYDSETGLFSWLSKTGSVSAGATAGTPHKGYLRIQVAGEMFRAHRLAFLYMTGSLPSAEVDHINGIKNDNRWGNLRLVDHLMNMQNQTRAHACNGCKTLGVSKQRHKYRARIRVDGKNKSLGMFDTPEAAHLSYVSAKRALHAGCAL
jgi:hypothetical protein